MPVSFLAVLYCVCCLDIALSFDLAWRVLFCRALPVLLLPLRLLLCLLGLGAFVVAPVALSFAVLCVAFFCPALAFAFASPCCLPFLLPYLALVLCPAAAARCYCVLALCAITSLGLPCFSYALLCSDLGPWNLLGSFSSTCRSGHSALL